MSKTKLLIWAVILAVPGGAGLWAIQARENLHQQKIHLWRQEVQQAVDQYLDSYQKWIALPQEQKNDTPWGQGSYGGPGMWQRLQQDQDKRLAVDIAELANGTKTIPTELGELLYGAQWQKKVADYQRDRQMYEIIKTLSFACLMIGVLIFIIIGIIWLAGTAVRFLRRTAQPGVQERKEQKPAPQPVAACPLSSKDTLLPPPQIIDGKSGTDKGYFESLPLYSRKNAASPRPSISALVNSPVVSASAVSETTPSMLMSPEPVLNSLTELTEEVSAIRQFAAQQQDQVRKLQDGYDWMLVRRFCMRIIHCIDNITNRIDQLNGQPEESNPHTLEDIRDELIFALESGGVEPFEPDIGAAYKGLERYAEAVHQRQPNDRPERSGTVARVLRPGYQYLINEKDVKIVRCAQVQLYE
jgi:molecular chaperone GrpE (heat shock protein)